MCFKVIVADDDEGMRLLLKKAIEKNSSFRVIAEAADGESAAFLAEEHQPDVLFLDVEMPVFNGIECAERILDKNPKTILIFVTAHEQYMPEAFRLYAFDYLVKPFHPERIAQTLDRIVLLHEQKDTSVAAAPQRVKWSGKLLIRNKEGITFLDQEEIILIQRENHSTVIYTANERYVTSEGLSELEGRLNPELFFRSHKSYIINLAMIYKIYPYGRWTYVVKLKNTSQDALITHEKYEELQRLFK